MAKHQPINQIPPPSPIDPLLDLVMMHDERIKLQTWLDCARIVAVHLGKFINPEDSLKLYDRYRKEMNR